MAYPGCHHGAAVTGAVCAALALMPATAQELRTELKGRGSPEAVRLRGAQPEAVMRCDTYGICQTSLFVFRGAAKGSQWDPTGCSVYWPYYRISVAKRWQPTLRWVLVKDPGDQAIYAFHPSNGIRLVPDPKNPTDSNDSRVDLHQPRVEQNGTAFAWDNLNLRANKKKIFFEPLVFRMNADGSRDRQCNFADPEVVNEN